MTTNAVDERGVNGPPAWVDFAPTARRKAVWTAIAAGMLLFFGFTSTFLGPPTAVAILTYTLKIGGFALLISAALLVNGRPSALAIDGIVAGIIGLAMLASALLHLIDSVEATGILLAVFGWLFASSGWHSFGTYRMVCRRLAGGAPGSQTSPAPDQRTDDCASTAAAAPASTIPTPGPAAIADAPEPADAPGRDADIEAPDRAPEGYLSSFASPEQKPPQD
jgi:hypothetical protein